MKDRRKIPCVRIARINGIGRTDEGMNERMNEGVSKRVTG